MKDQLCRTNDGYERDGCDQPENDVCDYGYSGALLDGQALEDQRVECKTDKIADGICDEVFGCRIAEHGNELQALNEYRKAKANRNVTEDIPLFENIAEHHAERCENEAVHDGIHDDFRFVSALSSVIEGDQVPLKPFQGSELLEIDIIIEEQVLVAELQHQCPDQKPGI